MNDSRQSMLFLNNVKHMSNNTYGDVSDGYHTFDELYHHRTMLFAALCNTYKTNAWKSKQHNDVKVPMYDGMFIAGIETPNGQATYHCEMKYWDMFNITELDRAPAFDGHTPAEAVDRLFKLSL